MLISSHLDLILTVSNPYILSRGIELYTDEQIIMQLIRPLVAEKYIFVTGPVIKKSQIIERLRKKVQVFSCFHDYLKIRMAVNVSHPGLLVTKLAKV